MSWLEISTNASHVGTAPPLLYAQSLHPCDGVADPTRPSGHRFVPTALSTSTSENQPAGIVDHATTLTPKAIQATVKPRGRKREEDRDADALPNKRAKTDHASGNSDDHDRSENKNGAPLGSPVQNDDYITVPTSGHAESTFDHDTNRANKDTNHLFSCLPMGSQTHNLLLVAPQMRAKLHLVASACHLVSQISALVGLSSVRHMLRWRALLFRRH